MVAIALFVFAISISWALTPLWVVAAEMAAGERQMAVAMQRLRAATDAASQILPDIMALQLASTRIDRNL